MRDLGYPSKELPGIALFTKGYIMNSQKHLQLYAPERIAAHFDTEIEKEELDKITDWFHENV